MDKTNQIIKNMKFNLMIYIYKIILLFVNQDKMVSINLIYLEI